MPASPGRRSRARTSRPASGASGASGAGSLARPARREGLKVGRPGPGPVAVEDPSFARRHGLSLARIGTVAGLAALTATLVALLGGQAYWMCVPAALLATSESRTRLGVAMVTAVLVAAGEGAGALARVHAMPSLALALLVPAASVAVLLALRERLEAQREVLRRSALTDPLTGLANRRSLLSRIDYEVSRHTRVRHPFGVMMLDLDGFKALNDRFGHPAGDDLLIDVAGAIARAVRDQDTVARMGGDEFCVLAPETDLAGTEQLAERVLAAVTTVTAGIEALGASAGVAVFPSDGSHATRLLEAADQRLLESKRRRGRGRGARRRAA